MKTIQEYIESGILEMYVMGNTSTEESLEIEQMAQTHPEISDEIEAIKTALEFYAEAIVERPHATVKPLLMASIDYMERRKKGEPETFPPVLNEGSKTEDYAEWLNRADMVPAENQENIYAKIIGHTKEVTTAIVWITEMAPHEVHDDEYEKFLIIEGTCDIIVGEKTHHLVPGDYFAIPLHAEHRLKVTSTIPCKAILQRIAA